MRYIIIKLSKSKKKKNLESVKKKVTHEVQGIPERLSVDLSIEILQGIRKLDDIFHKLKE